MDALQLRSAFIQIIAGEAAANEIDLFRCLVKETKTSPQELLVIASDHLGISRRKLVPEITAHLGIDTVNLLLTLSAEEELSVHKLHRKLRRCRTHTAAALMAAQEIADNYWERFLTHFERASGTPLDPDAVVNVLHAHATTAAHEVLSRLIIKAKFDELPRGHVVVARVIEFNWKAIFEKLAERERRTVADLHQHMIDAIGGKMFALGVSATTPESEGKLLDALLERYNITLFEFAFTFFGVLGHAHCPN